MSRKLFNALLWLSLATLGAPSQAEQSVDVGDYVIHYNALPTDALQPQVARNYGITRSPNQALLNVTVLRKATGTTGQPVRARVTATATNLNNQLHELDIREVDDQGAFYYLSTVKVNHGETLNFTVQVDPEKQGRVYTARFQQQFVTR